MKKKTTKSLKAKADELFSKYIRLKYMKNGYTACYTCHKTLEFKQAQNGHYVPRRHLATRWLEDNCRVQCLRCNCFMKGNYDEYSLRLIEEMGVEHLEYLNQKKNEVVKMKISDYEELIFSLQEKLKGI